ncbi:MAG: hypothetical protein LQ340_001544 [Diploschistes diacapsis]|nr:MAG: hypothetical protein LQ340_001544 [Diploschistes diacapsis]
MKLLPASLSASPTPSFAQPTLNSLLLLLCSFNAGFAFCHPRSWTVGQPVQTTSGTVAGHAASNLTHVSEYLGIPYAQPPLGALRFKAPQKDCPANVAPRSVANAGITNLAGPQAVTIIDNIEQYGHTVSEDCLTLNVWTKPQTGDAKKAVMVWIYGGGFQSGSTNTFLYNGQVLANYADVVVVTINYRVNVFGFPGLPDSGVPQNTGLLDQRLAIEWVRDNIASFGGDASRITLFGQSAGATSIDFYSYAWTADPIVAGLIPESGVATSFANPTPPNNTASWYSLSSNLGCGDSGTPLATTVACMQSKTMTQILQAEGSLGLQFNPSVDGTTVFSNYDALTQAGQFIKVPVLLGNNDYEAGIIKVLFQEIGITQSNQAWAILNLEDFTCPVGHRAAGKASQVPVWRYRYFGEWENTRLTFNPDSGAWHGSEIPVVFGTASGSGVANSAIEVKIGEYIIGAWTSFAKNPSGGLSAAPYQWPKCAAAGILDVCPDDEVLTVRTTAASLIQLGFQNQTHASYIYPVTYDYACQYVLAPGGPNMTALAGVANLTQLGGGSQVGY